MPSKSKKNQTIIGSLPDGQNVMAMLHLKMLIIHIYRENKQKKTNMSQLVYHGNLLLTKNIQMSELIIISIKCLPTDDWDCERPNH